MSFRIEQICIHYPGLCVYWPCVYWLWLCVCLNYVYPALHSLKTDTILYKVVCLNIENFPFFTQNCSSECHKGKDRFKINECALEKDKEPRWVSGIYVVIVTQYAKYCDYNNTQYNKQSAFQLRAESNRHDKQSSFLIYE